MRTQLSTKEISAKIRSDLKAALPQCKFSVTCEYFSMGSSIDVRLMAGPESPLTDSLGYAQINEFMLQDRYQPDPFRNNGCILTDFGLTTLRKTMEIVNQYHWDDSDAQSDYFSCNFYLHLSVGKWDRDYEVKGGK